MTKLAILTELNEIDLKFKNQDYDNNGNAIDRDADFVLREREDELLNLLNTL